MKEYAIQEGETTIRYYRHAAQTRRKNKSSKESPSLLIVSGIHGDEFEIIGLIKKTLRYYLPQMPSFIYIPEASPSAVRKKTRLNKEGIDINRNFLRRSSSEEVRAVMKISQRGSYDLCLSFHEDMEQNHFYLYDTENLHGSSSFRLFKKTLVRKGIKLLNGIDDPSDPILGHEFEDGYKWITLAENKMENGTFESWLIKTRVAKRVCVPEIPGMLKKAKKQYIINEIFKNFIIK